MNIFQRGWGVGSYDILNLYCYIINFSLSVNYYIVNESCGAPEKANFAVYLYDLWNTLKAV